MKLIRVFPRKTRLTPEDENVRIGSPGLFDEADQIHISVTFTEDLPIAERLAKEWEIVAPVRVGGPATGERGGDFVPGLYLKKGAVITSRGCPNRCWFCSAWRREGNAIRELPITDGWNVLDDNLLRCSENHVRGVFDMLRRQSQPVKFTGGLEAAALEDWHIDLLTHLRLERMYFAYDTSDDYEPLRLAGKRLAEAGFTFAQHKMSAYCLIGYEGDTFEAAEKRLYDCVDAGFVPMAMLYRDGKRKPSKDWRKFAGIWARPRITLSLVKRRTS